MGNFHAPRFGNGEVVVYDDRTGQGYICADRSRAEVAQVYFDRQSLRDSKTQLRVGARVLFKTDRRGDCPKAVDLCLEPSITDELAKLPDVVTGKVVHTNEEKSYGFIQVSPRVRAWFPFSTLAHPNLTPLEGDRVSCNIRQTPDGRLQAHNVLILDPVEQSPDSGHDGEATGTLRAERDPARRDAGFEPKPGEARSGYEYLHRAQRAVQEGDDLRAQQFYEEGVREAPTQQLILSYAAWLRRRGQPSEAMRIFEHGITKIPPSANVFAHAGSLALALKDFGKAVMLLESALQFTQGNKQVLTELGKAFFLMGSPEDLQKSLGYYERAIEAYGGLDEFKRNAYPRGPLEGHYNNYLTLCERLNTEPASERNRTLTGRIVSFGNAGFGFIDADKGSTLFFDLDDIADENLGQLLRQPDRPIGLSVVFNEVPAPGRKYDCATNVRPQQSSEDWLRQAREMQAASRPRDALPLVELALRLDSQNPAAQSLKEEIVKQLSTIDVLPKGTGPYALAKRAETLEKDIVKAERFYRLAIERYDKRESAVKDLAWLLSRQHKTEEAVKLLKANRNFAQNKDALDSTLATIYEHSDQFEQVIGILSPLVQRAERRTKPQVLKRLAYAYLQLQQFSQAIEALQEALQISSADAGAQRLLLAAQQAQAGRTSGQAEEVLESLGSEEDFASPLSPMAESMVSRILKEGFFKGLDASKIESGKLTENDAFAVAEVAKKFGTDKPQDRAEYYLSAAAILKRAGADDYGRRFREFLQRSFASMGDAVLLARKNPEVARTFYAESMGLSVGEGLPWYAFIWFVRSFGSAELQKGLSEDIRSSAILQAVSQDLIRRSCDVTGLWSGLFRLAGRNAVGFRMFWLAVEDSGPLRNSLSAFLVAQGCDISAGLQQSFEQFRNRVAAEQSRIESRFAAFRRGSLTVPAIEGLIHNLGQLENAGFSELERQRLGVVRQTASDALAFCQTDDFDEAQNHYYVVQARAEKFATDVEANPTATSFESFVPLVRHLRSLVEDSYADRARTSVPELTLELVSEEYVPVHGNEITLQVRVSNRAGSSRASNLDLEFLPGPESYISMHERFFRVADSLRGNSSVVRQVPVCITPAAQEQKAFPITIQCRYQDSLGTKRETGARQVTVSLFDPSEFREIDPNPYFPYTETGAVEDPNMFFGRKKFIDQIRDALLGGEGTKCFVLYGQKRAGKTSILYHLQCRLAECECLPAFFSLQDIQGELNICNLLTRILQAIRTSIGDEADKRGEPPPFTFPTIAEVAASPTLIFHDCLSQLVRKLKKTAGWERLRLVLLVDEFTDVFTQIQQGKMPPEVMKLWKAIIERHYFSCVLVGRDIMPAFQAKFANEFGVTQDLRITYLSEEGARELLETPIGGGRYRSRAVSRVLELTAGSPYYTMMVCDRLVEYINHTKSLVVTEADIEKIKDSMVSGDQSLREAKFDPLFDPGEKKVTTDIDPQQCLAVCAAIAKNATAGWCAASALPQVAGDQIKILNDLVFRDVLEQKQDSYRIRVGLFHEWLLANK